MLPGIWIEDTLNMFWKRYIYLVHTEEENGMLKKRLAFLEEELAQRKEAVEQNKRLRSLLQLEMPQYTKIFAEVCAIRFGPLAIADTLLINKGSSDAIEMYSPVLVSTGLVGRVIRLAHTKAIVLPITAPDSKLAVITSEGRVSGIIVGNGGDKDLEMLYVPRSVSISVGEEIVTSGVDGVFPKGIPVGVVSSVEEEDLFHIIRVRPFIDIRSLEEVIVLNIPQSEISLLGVTKDVL